MIQKEEKRILTRNQVSLAVKKLTRGNADQWTFIDFNVEGIRVHIKVYNGYLQRLLVGTIQSGEMYFDTKLQLVQYVSDMVNNYIEHIEDYSDTLLHVQKGNKVLVTNLRGVYPEYYEWDGLNHYRKHFMNNLLPEVTSTYKIVHLEKHGSDSGIILALIQDIITDMVFIVDIDCLEVIKEDGE